MNLDSTTIAELKEKQLATSKAAKKVSIIITGFQEDAGAKATFYNVTCSREMDDGSEKTSDGKYRYSQLLEFNETLLYNYGAIRILRLFPPKKLIGNKEGNFVQQRMEQIQKWMTEMVTDEELSEDPDVLKFFNLE